MKTENESPEIILEPSNCGCAARVCSDCRVKKPISEFHNSKGHLYGKSSICKECAKAKTRRWRTRHPKRESANKARWVALNPLRVREYQKAWRAANPDRKNQSDKRYRLTEKCRLTQVKGQRIYKLRNPQKALAHRRLNGAVRSGRIVRLPCAVCSDPKSQGHHEDYSKPLDVIWLCRKHHLELHKNYESAFRSQR